MASKNNRGQATALAVAALLLSSVCFFFGTGVRPVWWLTLLAPLPVLLVAPRAPGLVAFGIATLSWFAGTLNMWRYLRNILVVPSPSHVGPLVMPVGTAVGTLLVHCCIFGLAVLLSRKFMRLGALWRAALIFPAVWVTYEYLTTIFSPHSTFGNIAYTQMNFLPLLQVASVAGVSGITFCLFLFPASVATLWAGSGSPAQKRAFAAGVGTFFIVVMAFGWWRLHFAPKSEHSVVVGLMASDLAKNLEIEEPDNNSRLMRDYLNQAKELVEQGAEVIVLPEKLSVLIEAEIGQFDNLFKEAAATHHTRFVVGVLRIAPGARLNEARMYSPESPSVLTYEKRHMLPKFESKLRPGTARVRIERPSGLWGIAICKDLDFPPLSRQYGNDGVGLMLVPAWDFGDDAWLHDRMAVMRGVESGFSIARAAKEGLLTVSDNRGRILAEKSSASAPFAVAVASVPVQNEKTLYARFGDWFAWLNIALGLGIVGSLGFARAPVRT